MEHAGNDFKCVALVKYGLWVMAIAALEGWAVGGVIRARWAHQRSEMKGRMEREQPHNNTNTIATHSYTNLP